MPRNERTITATRLFDIPAKSGNCKSTSRDFLSCLEEPRISHFIVKIMVDIFGNSIDNCVFRG